MLKQYARHIKFAAVVLLVMLALVASLTASTPNKASTPAVAPATPTDYHTCTPIGVATFTSRVHVRCSTAAPGGIYWFAVSTADSGSASRFLSVFMTAKVTGKNLGIFYTASDTSGNAWGCSASDCRVAWGAEVLQ